MSEKPREKSGEDVIPTETGDWIKNDEGAFQFISNEYEKSQIDAFRAEVMPSDDYRQGHIKVDSEHALSQDISVKFTEDDYGIVKVLLEGKEGKEVDVSKFLPPHWTFVSPKFLLEHKLNVKQAGEWRIYPDHRHVGVGEFKGKNSLLALLHELGHATEDENQKRDLAIACEYYLYNKTLGNSQDLNEELSLNERNAWASAIKMMRQLRQEGIDLFEVFEWKDVKVFMNLALASYVESAKSRDKKAKHLEGQAVKDAGYLEDLFDKSKIKKLLLDKKNREV